MAAPKQSPRRRGPNGKCQVCRHSDRYRIELLRAGGASLYSLATRFDVDKDALQRHWTGHVSVEAKAEYICGPVQLRDLAVRASAEGLSLLDYLSLVRSRLLQQFSAACDAGDRSGTALLAGRLLEALREIGKLTGELMKGAGGVSTTITNNNTLVMNSPLFADLQTALIRCLAPFPDARSAVVAALRELEMRGETALEVCTRGMQTPALSEVAREIEMRGEPATMVPSAPLLEADDVRVA